MRLTGTRPGEAAITPFKRRADQPGDLSLAAAPNGDVWVGTPDGLNRIRGSAVDCLYVIRWAARRLHPVAARGHGRFVVGGHTAWLGTHDVRARRTHAQANRYLHAGGWPRQRPGGSDDARRRERIRRPVGGDAGGPLALASGHGRSEDRQSDHEGWSLLQCRHFTPGDS